MIFSTKTFQKKYNGFFASAFLLSLDIFVLMCTSLLPVSVYASTTTGSIDPLFHNAIVCHDVTCASPAPGSINFSPLGTTPVTIDNVSGVRGVAWGNELGWINELFRMEVKLLSPSIGQN